MSESLKTIIFIIFLTLNTTILFGKELSGTITFTQRDEDGVSNLYTILANGKNKTLIFKNTSKINKNVLFPKWSGDGKKIFFTAMKDGDWKLWSINKDGSNAKILAGQKPNLKSHESRENDIEVKQGSIYLKENPNTAIYTHKDFDPKFNTGAHEVSWGPKKKYIIFAVTKPSFFSKVKRMILILSKDRKSIRELTEGGSPDWTP